VKLFCKRPNKASPFIILLENVYFILEYIVNLISTSQLGIDLIAFNLEILCLKAFSLTKVLCFIFQINCYYVLNTVPGPKSTFMKYMNLNLNLDIYLILSLLEHLLLL
jgi:hypothetical protein